MKKILILGAGRSSFSLIQYLVSIAKQEKWEVVIGDLFPDEAKKKISGVRIFEFNIEDKEAAEKILPENELVISMLPAKFHILVASICASKGIHLITASYLTDEIKELDPLFRQNKSLCIMEMGLDPGIDHMSAMNILDQIKRDGHKLTGFETFTGGLLKDNTEKDNPWHYKFTWNPRNVVMAGSGHVKFIQEGKFKYIPYHRLFNRTEIIHIPGHGHFEGYANRDSLKYLDMYNLREIGTLFRGTLRRPGYCKAWNVFVQIGATDDTFTMEGVTNMTHRQFINSFLDYNPHDSVELKLAHYMNFGMGSDEMYRLQWLGIFDDEPVGLNEGTPAQILEHILKKKWTLDDTDLDMIVMWHKFDYLDKGRHKQIQAHMVVTGDDQKNTAMAKTVGLPLGITTKLIMRGKIDLTGVHIPTKPELYLPVLAELDEMGFEFMERETIS